MVSSLILLRSLRVYILKQLFFSISVNSGLVALGIFSSPLHGSVNILPLFTSISKNNFLIRLSYIIPEKLYKILSGFSQKKALNFFLETSKILQKLRKILKNFGFFNSDITRNNMSCTTHIGE